MIRPLGGRVVVKPLSEEAVTKSGLILLDGVEAYSRGGTAAEGGPQPKLPWGRARVVSIGPGKRSKDYSGREPVEVKVGDTILYDERGVLHEFIENGVRFQLASAASVKGVLE